MKGISKSFPGVKALQNVNLQLKAGEVHALLGENGAGKSTLIKVLGGIYHAEEGEIFIDDQKVEINDVVTARQAGVSIVHQELVLVPYMTVAENIFLGREPGTRMNVDRVKMSRDAQELLDAYHKWIAYSISWKKQRNDSMTDLQFPFPYREGQREIVSGVTPDDRYVVEALMNVRPGMTVKPVREKTKR